MNLEELYSDIIKEHSLSAHNKGHIAGANVVMPGKNPSCGDEIELELQIENGIIRDGAFTGIGCAVSQASASIMIDWLRGKTVEEGQRAAALFLKMAQRQTLSDQEYDYLQEAAALKNIADMPARVKCATMPWHTLVTALEQYPDRV